MKRVARIEILRAIAALAAFIVLVTSCTTSEEPDIRPVADTPEILTVLGAGQSDGSLVPDDDLRQLWARLLYQELPRETVYVNLAASGATVDVALRTQVEAAVELDPSTVAAWFVTADAEVGTPIEQYRAALVELVDAFPDADVLLFTGWNGRDPAIEAPYVEVIREVARSSAATLVDLSAIDADDPNAQQLVADEVLAVIEAP